MGDSGEIVITEDADNCVSIFTQDGVKSRTFGTSGYELGQFVHPRGVTFDSAGNILVADEGRSRIQKFTVNGTFLTAVGGKFGSGDLEFKNPIGIGFNHKNKKVYVCERWGHRVQVLNEDLTFSSSFEGQFMFPWDVAFDSTGNVYIADTEYHCIHVFTAEGWFLRKFGRKGSGEGELEWPSSVSIDSNDIVYVAERDNSRVSMFTSQGKFIRSFETIGKEEFCLPCGIAVDTSGLLYVCDTYNDRVLIFRIHVHSTS